MSTTKGEVIVLAVGAGLPIIVWFLGLIALVVEIGAVVDASKKSTEAFTAAGSSKGMWITLIVVFALIFPPVGLILAIVYLASIRPRVIANGG